MRLGEGMRDLKHLYVSLGGCVHIRVLCVCLPLHMHNKYKGGPNSFNRTSVPAAI